ncbi:MAG TPA: type II toxin-antitoxin system ParD family antitoxin [Pirellulales bacterium]|nr:type II toxin-antitoxin system ParD family antitoxin [Pirellulales bacterium]
MSYAFPPDLQRAVDERMAAGGYESADELLLDAVRALDHLEKQYQELRAEIRERLDRRGKAPAQPIDFEAFKAELRATLPTTK